MLKITLISLSFLFSLFAFTQNSIQFGQRIKVGNQKLYYSNNLDGYYGGTYNLDINFVTPSTETIIKISSLKIIDTSKFSIGYSLELGYMFSTEKINSSYYYTKNIPWVSDTIGYHSSNTTKYNRQITISNNLDFNYRFSDKYIFVNSLGFKLESKNIYKHKSTSDGHYLFNGYQDLQDREQFTTTTAPKDHITMKLTYSPQLIINYTKFSLNINLTQDFLRITKLLIHDVPQIFYGSNSHLSTYTGIGFFFIPHFNKKKDESELLQEDFDY